MSSIIDVVNARTSASSYDTTKTLSDAEIRNLVELAAKSPSAFNLQNWNIVAVATKEAKERLLPKAMGQMKVVDAAVTFIICGTLNVHETIAPALKPTLDAGIIDQETFDGWVGAVNSMYSQNTTMQRDEAIRSGALFAMSLMLIARGEGLVSCPMIGFDPKGVAEEFGLSDNDVPVMLVTVGYAADGNWPQKPRKSLDEILTIS